MLLFIIFLAAVYYRKIAHALLSVCRQQDVRATEIDKVDMYQSYRPGDIVRALVVSLRREYRVLI